MVESLDGDLGATNFTDDGSGCSAEPTPGITNAACTIFVEGCTDEAASNYNPEANLDAGCEYPVIVPSCVLGTVYITEAHGKGEPEDYIEIYNAGDADCSLLGFQLDDEQPFGDFTFGDVTIAAGEYWLGYEDAEGSFSSGIGGGGDNLYLGDTLGNVLMVETYSGVYGATNFTSNGTGCSAEPTPGTINSECTLFEKGCIDPKAANYNPGAIEQEYDQWNNIVCTFESCENVPYEGCRYTDAFAGWNNEFGASDCINYGGTPCENNPCDDCAFNEKCVDGNCQTITPISTNLPVVYINTENQTSIKSKSEGYVNGLVTVVGGESIKTGSTLSGLDSRVMEIRGRGNSTWVLHPKKPFQMKLAEKAEFLDMPNDKKWLFLAEHSDKTMLRNTMAFEMGHASSLDWTPAGEFAEVYINGSYNGTYNITQKVEEKTNRVNIGSDGFLMEIDQIERLDQDDHYFSTNEFPVINIKEPDINDIIEDDGAEKADSAVSKVSDFINQFETALFSENFSDPELGYAKYIDVESFIDWFLISEILKNVDSKSFSSIYFHVVFDENDQGLIKMGPLWDFDLSFGNTDYADSQYPEGWWVKNNPWIAQLMLDPSFEEKVIARFEDHFHARKGTILDKIESYSNALTASAVENDSRWAPYIGSYAWPNPYVGDLATGNTGAEGYQDAVDNIANWYNTRMEWLKENFSSVEGCVDEDAVNYQSSAVTQDYDQWGNSTCIYASCNDIPDAEGCRYSSAYSPFHDNFNAGNCEEYGGTACVNTSIVSGCIDENATNFNAAANTQYVDPFGNIVCTYNSCTDIPQPGCIYPTAFGAFTEGFGANACSGYGGIPCGDNTVVTEVLVTFQVDMSNEDVHPEGLYLAGGDLGQEGFLMNDIGNNVFRVTLTVEPNRTYMYKFRNQPSYGTWDGFESGSGLRDGNCNTGQYDDRYVVVEESNLVLDVVTYGSCFHEIANDVLGCIDINASNYNNAANVQSYDQYNNSTCIYASCDDIPDEEGCSYWDAYSPFGDNFTPENCESYGGTACTSNTVVLGCIDVKASNYNSNADIQSYDQYNNSTCAYASCDDIPDEEGCSYSDGYTTFRDDFTPENCETYGGTACTLSSDVIGCMDSNASNYDPSATEQEYDQWNNIVCTYASCEKVPYEGCRYAIAFAGWHEGFGPGECINYGGTPCEEVPADIEGCLDNNALNYNSAANVQAVDQYGNILCVYASCNDVPSDGCNYGNSFAPWNEWFGANDCIGYGGTPCESEASGCTDPSALNYNSNATIDDDSCDYPECSPGWSSVLTDQNHSIFITGEWTDINGNPMTEGAAIGVFYEDDHGALKSAGWKEFSEGTVQIAAMGDDESTTELDGLKAGNKLEFRVWDPNACEEYPASVTFTGGPESYTANGITFINTVTAKLPSPKEQELNIVKGWSIISTYMIPENTNFAEVISPIVEHLIIAKNFSGAAYLPEYNFNGIGNVVVGQGYQIKTSVACNLTISGDYAAPEQNPISCVQGWNMIGYLRTESAPCDMVLADMVDQLIIAKNSDGLAYLPEYNFNGIGHMKPGEGYQIKTTESGNLHYLSNDVSYRISSLEVIESNLSHFAKVPVTGNNMTVVIEDGAWDVLPEEGAELAAFDHAGHMIGSASYSSPVTALAVWGDDATTSTKDGSEVSEAVSFKVWTSDEVREFTVKEWTEGSSSYHVDAINVASSIETYNTITEMNATVKELLKVVNVLGQEVSLNDDSFKGKVLFNIYNDGTVEKVVK